MMQKLYAFLARAPALQGLTVQVGDVGPAPGTVGLWAGGITVLDRRQNLLGTVRQRCRAEFTLRLCLPDTRAENETRLLALQARAPRTARRCSAVSRSRSACARSRVGWSAPRQAARWYTPCACRQNTHSFIRRKCNEN